MEKSSREHGQTSLTVAPKANASPNNPPFWGGRRGGAGRTPSPARARRIDLDAVLEAREIDEAAILGNRQAGLSMSASVSSKTWNWTSAMVSNSGQRKTRSTFKTPSPTRRGTTKRPLL